MMQTGLRRSMVGFEGVRSVAGAKRGFLTSWPVKVERESYLKEPSLRMDTMNKNLKEMQYAVRGEVPIRASEIEEELRLNGGRGKTFEKILYCNIGNPQAVGQKPIQFYRHVLSLVNSPELMGKNRASLRELFSDEAIQRSEEIISFLPSGTGAYSDSQGVRAIRENVAQFIQDRDGYPSDYRNIFLSNGASSSIQMLLTAIISNPTDAVMIPIPQYPIYTALIRLLNGQDAGYYLNEENQWSLSMDALERSYERSISKGHKPRAMVIINPGNPTGNILSYDDLANVLHFCDRHNLILLADEVYQENCYNKRDRPFHSAKKVMNDLGLNVELASFHSTSKGFIGECGRRGGYMELSNFDEDVQAQIVKLASSGLCSNLDGQIMTDLMVRPPTSGEAGQIFQSERQNILDSLKVKAEMVHDRLNAIPGVSCQPLQGAMYAFPRIDLPNSFIQKAERMGKTPDGLYALSLLESTGICTVPGSGFEQEPGTHHLRMTFLPKPEDLEIAMDKFKAHHMNLV